ncbi:MAG: hypothetical protein MO846_04695 [Candidatus Devosia symbiotica]|nr:hypothetical protein [Candidatus Devosia symbiotica]
MNIFLFNTLDGVSRATIKGHVSYYLADRNKIFEIMAFLPLAKAFSTTIRMINRNDVKILVSGDRDLWDSNWGLLGTAV